MLACTLPGLTCTPQVAATAFNKSSSRSHTITRIMVEVEDAPDALDTTGGAAAAASPQPQPPLSPPQPPPSPPPGWPQAGGPPGARGRAGARLSEPVPEAEASTSSWARPCTYACLDLIDLAGSESARTIVTGGQKAEGSFINKSLLTLGTVIYKLSGGGWVGRSGAGGDLGLGRWSSGA